MEDGRFPLNTMSADTNSNVDFDLMDELLAGGCWLETIPDQGADFLQPPSSSNSTNFFNSSNFILPTISESLNQNPPQDNKQQDTERSIIPRIPTSIQPQSVTSIGTRYSNPNTIQDAEFSGQSERNQTEGSYEFSRRLWIPPDSNSTSLSPVKERLNLALEHIKNSIRNGDVLIQIWVPVNRGGKQFLVTSDQPFTLGHSSRRLSSYRSASMEYQFPADEDSSESVGLPGRVFLGKVPEWTPDVRFFSSDEYPRIDHAQRYDVRGTLALPIFERGSRSCLGVVEIVMTTQKINYRSDLENVCRALESVNLRGSEGANPSIIKAPNISYQAVLPEILNVMRAVCETHRLPLAQTWVPCILQAKEGCRHSDENYVRCVSTVDSACCITDPQILGFHEACSEHHLFRGQGVTGRAFTTNQPCFSSDITTFSMKEYPLSHYARMFGLRAAVAIRLRSMYTGSTDYVLEFFLPVHCLETEDQKKMLSSLSVIIQKVCQSLRVVTDSELQEDIILINNELTSPLNHEPNRETVPNLGPSGSKESSRDGSSWITQLMEVQRKNKTVLKEEPTEGFKVTTQWDSPDPGLQQGQPLDSGIRDPGESGGDSSLGEHRFSRTGEKRRTKLEKTISLQVLRQYFAGSLKDAAKSIGVCPTTLKRICRQHGITRWPSRKIKKVGHSLRKLQVVMDSVQGAEGAFQIGSIYANFPELTSPKLTKPQSNDQSNLSNIPTTQGGSSPQAPASKSSSSSGSQSSSSSLCCTSSKQQNPLLSNNEDPSMVENTCGQEDFGLLATSHSQRYLFEHHSLDECLPPLPSSSRDKSALRVKVTYGEEKVRFSMQFSWTLGDLQLEISRRFLIDDMSKIDLKYLDDDSEWVLLTCDADLEECMDIYKSSQTQTLKLTVHQTSHPNLGSSFGSNLP